MKAAEGWGVSYAMIKDNERMENKLQVLDFGNGWRGIQDEKGQKLNDTDTVIDKQAQPKVELIAILMI